MKLLEQPDARLGPDPRKARDELLLTALAAAVGDLTKRMGRDQTQWHFPLLYDRTAVGQQVEQRIILVAER